MGIRYLALTILFATTAAASQTIDPQTTPPAVPAATSQASHPLVPDSLLDQADGVEKATSFESRVTFEYRYHEFEDGSSGDSIYLHWLQSFGPSKRLAAEIEFPVIYESGPDAAGIGDITLKFRGMLGKGEKFEQVAGLAITVPSGSQGLIDEGHILDGQTVLGVEWGCTAKLTEHTEVSFDLRYHKGVHNRGPGPKRNYVEPELIVTQALAKHVAGYLEWNQYYEFSKSLYVPLLKPGFEIAMDREKKWSISPFIVFPLNRNARIEETKLGVGVVLNFTF